MEEWKKIPDRNHEISTEGNVRNQKTGRVLKASPNKRGYPRVSLSNGTNKTPTVVFPHILVAKAFIPNPENKPMVNHKNKNKADPHKDNLEWVTAKENSVHDFNTDPAGVTARCKKACEASLLVNSKKVTAVNVKTNVTQSFNSQSECARSLQVANTTLVNAIKNEKEINGYIVKKD